MVEINLRGVHRVRAKGQVYYYAWRGGPRLKGEPGSPEFVASYGDAQTARKSPATGTLQEVITKYRASPAYMKLGAHTKRAYDPALTEIARRWGALPTRLINDPRIRRHFLGWRDSMAGKPRSADMAVGVLKRLLGWGVEYVHLTANQAEPIGRLHRVDKSEDIWTPEDVAAFLASASTELRWALELAIHTGLRQGDLIKLAWGHDEGDVIAYRTSKRGKRVTIPVTPDLRALLGRIERRGTVILTTQRGKLPWTADGLRSSFGKACHAASPAITRTFHDLRRTAATNLLRAGLEPSQVGMIMGWSSADVEAMQRRYVSRTAVVEAVLAKLRQAV